MFPISILIGTPWFDPQPAWQALLLLHCKVFVGGEVNVVVVVEHGLFIVYLSFRPESRNL